MRTASLGCTLGLAVALGVAACGEAQIPEDLVRAYLWPPSAAEFEAAEAALMEEPFMGHASREQMTRLADLVRRGPFVGASAPPLTTDSLLALTVDAPGGRSIPVIVRLPSGYTPGERWPLMLAMHGGPPGSVEGALRGAENMISVWVDAAEAAGWILASPAMVSVVARDGRTQERLPYEIFHPEEARAVVDAVRRSFNIDPDRIVSTGISLGSNFSIGFAAAHPDWLSAIVPVSTEGESREHLLRNLATVPVYVLEGAQDRNIRGVSGPRALDRILTDFGYDLTYREFGDRAHEGFQEHYPEVLEWLEGRARARNPREVLRVPHTGIMPLARRVHWIETDTRQAIVRARVTSSSRIDVVARRAGSVTMFLSDELLDLDGPIDIYVNGVRAFSGPVSRSGRTALEDLRRRGDEGPLHAAKLTLPVAPTEASLAIAAELSDELAPSHPEGQLSFWEMYAVRALEERFPSVGFSGDEVPLPASIGPHAPEQVAVLVTAVEPAGAADRAGLAAGDVLVTVDGEPFFRGMAGVSGLREWMMRELRETERAYPMVVVRDGAAVILESRYALGPYRHAAP